MMKIRLLNPNENYARELLELYTIGVGKPIYIDNDGNVGFDGDPLNYSEIN